eukprot:gb/GECG01011640.1/.p1 GENE.gb/GECG01011640.1/~~gb/GECG01011640.1/.p1  ORF type:complete len:1211 (+),score=161.06 gb/GECG01011640.1/:1-3633(+)
MGESHRKCTCIQGLQDLYTSLPTPIMSTSHIYMVQATSAIVVMRICGVRSFQGGAPYFSYATGFVVDKDNGIILTNRHVCTVGPISAECVFHNKEEATCIPIYRDPIHDFGFFHYDPHSVKFMQVKEMKLAPEEAKVGTEIKVIGNDAGEKLSILSGTISRLDRGAPYYGNREHSDFNTFYIAAATSTSGGSSGSPVVNINGNAVALNAGGKRGAASSFYFPLDRVKRALKMIQARLHVPRGTLGGVIKHEPFDEVTRLGLSNESETEVRQWIPDETGMLVVSEILADSPGDGILKEGDVITKVSGRVCTHFVALEEAVDNTIAMVQAVRLSLDTAGRGEYKEGCGNINERYSRNFPTNMVDDSLKEFTDPSLFRRLDKALSTIDSKTLAEALHLASTRLRDELSGKRRRTIVGSIDTEKANVEEDDNYTSLYSQWRNIYMDPIADESLPDRCAEISTDRSLTAPANMHTENEALKFPRSPLTINDMLEAIVLQAEDAPARKDDPQALYKKTIPCSSRVERSLEQIVRRLEECCEQGTTSKDNIAGLADAIAAFEPMVSVEVERGGEKKELDVRVGNLHGLIPHKFYEFSSSVLHAVSIESSKLYGIPIGYPYVSSKGYAFSRADVPHNSIITQVGAMSTPNPEKLVEALLQYADTARTTIKFFLVEDKHTTHNATIMVDWKWFVSQSYTRDDCNGMWIPETLPSPPDRLAKEPSATTFPAVTDDPVAEQVLRSLVVIENNVPYQADALHSPGFLGVGVILDAEKGLVLADRNTVPIGVADISLVFAASVEIPAETLFLHPYHNFAILKFDPTLIGNTKIKSLAVNPASTKVGENYDFIGLSSDYQLVHHKAVVTKKERMALGDIFPPRYRCYNHETVCFDRVPSCIGGVFVSGGRDSGPSLSMIAYWASYALQEDGDMCQMDGAMPSEFLADVIEPLVSGRVPRIASLETEFHPFPLVKARNAMELPQKWVEEVERHSREQRQVLMVTRSLPGTSSSEQLQSGDLLLQVGATVPVTFRDVEVALNEFSEKQPFTNSRLFFNTACLESGTAGKENPPVPCKVLRNGKEVDVEISPAPLDGTGTSRLVMWSGMMLQVAHRPVLEKGFVPETGSQTPYCSRWQIGSPAHKYGMRATIWLTEINGQTVDTLDRLLEIVKPIGHHSNVRIRGTDLKGKEKVYTMKTDLNYWPTVDLWRDDFGEWHHRLCASEEV